MRSELPTRPIKEELDIREPGVALADLSTTFQVEADLTIVLDTANVHDRRVAETIAAALKS